MTKSLLALAAVAVHVVLSLSAVARAADRLTIVDHGKSDYRILVHKWPRAGRPRIR